MPRRTPIIPSALALTLVASSLAMADPSTPDAARAAMLRTSDVAGVGLPTANAERFFSARTPRVPVLCRWSVPGEDDPRQVVLPRAATAYRATVAFGDDEQVEPVSGDASQLGYRYATPLAARRAWNAAMRQAAQCNARVDVPGDDASLQVTAGPASTAFGGTTGIAVDYLQTSSSGRGVVPTRTTWLRTGSSVIALTIGLDNFGPGFTAGQPARFDALATRLAGRWRTAR